MGVKGLKTSCRGINKSLIASVFIGGCSHFGQSIFTVILVYEHSNLKSAPSCSKLNHLIGNSALKVKMKKKKQESSSLSHKTEYKIDSNSGVA